MSVSPSPSRLAMTKLIVRELFIKLSLSEMLVLLEVYEIRKCRPLEELMHELFPLAIKRVCERDEQIYPMVMQLLKEKNIHNHPLIKTSVQFRIRNFLYNRPYQARVAREVLEQLAGDEMMTSELDRFQTEYEENIPWYSQWF